MLIGEIIKIKQPDIYIILLRISRMIEPIEEKINYKKLMEDAPVYKRHHRAWKQVRNG